MHVKSMQNAHKLIALQRKWQSLMIVSDIDHARRRLRRGLMPFEIISA